MQTIRWLFHGACSRRHPRPGPRPRNGAIKRRTNVVGISSTRDRGRRIDPRLVLRAEDRASCATPRSTIAPTAGPAADRLPIAKAWITATLQQPLPRTLAAVERARVARQHRVIVVEQEDQA
jgi:hypothetical protein